LLDRVSGTACLSNYVILNSPPSLGIPPVAEDASVSAEDRGAKVSVAYFLTYEPSKI